MPTDVLVRPAITDDAAAITHVQLASRKAAAMPPSIHHDPEALPWITSLLEGDDEMWVAESDGVVVAYMRLTATWLDDLYVAPAHVGCGVGTLLLDLAKSLRPAGFGLWVFEINAPARAFYARHGLVEVERTDGRDNEEREPDIRMTWTPS
ncbi:MAG: GNAT family N-acetyltransferase [Nocardioides sp.]